MLDCEKEGIPLESPDRRRRKTMSQRMQFDEEPELGGYRAFSPPPTYQESGSTSDPLFERAPAEKLKPVSLSYPRSVRLLGLLLLVLGVLLIFGFVLSTQISLTFLFVVIAVIADVLFFLGFWLLLVNARRSEQGLPSNMRNCPQF